MKNKREIPLLNFEAYCENDRLLAAEKLFDDNALQNLHQDRSGYWRGTVGNTEKFQTEVLVQLDHIQSANCSCHDLTNPDFCTHLICTFFGIRHNSADYKPSDPPKTTQISRNKSDIKKILANASKEELENFLKAYATKDRKLKLFLKAHFARSYNEFSSGNIYEKILDEGFPAIKDGKPVKTSMASQMVVSIGKELLLQFDDAISLEQYTDAFQLIQALINKFSYAVNLYSNPGKYLVQFLHQVHVSFEKLLNDRVAPKLRQDIQVFMLDIIQKSYYNYTDKYNLYLLFFDTKPGKEDLKRYLIILRYKINQTDTIREIIFYQAILLKLLFQLYNYKTEFNWFKTYCTDKYVFLASLNKMLELGYFEATDQLLETLQKKKLIDHKLYLQYKLKIARFNKDDEASLGFALSLFNIGYEFSYIDQIKTFSGSEWPKYYSFIIDKLIQSKAGTHHNTALRLSATEQDWKKLLKFLIQHNELSFFMQYDRMLAKHYKIEIFNFYQSYLSEYLKHHIGLKATHHTSKIIEHLNDIGLGKEAQKLRKILLASYPERKNLQDQMR